MAFTFDRKKFFDGYREKFGGLTKQQVAGLEWLLGCIEADSYVTRIDWAAYMLATTKHETADTFHPIHEYGSKAYFIKRYGGQTKKGKELGNDTAEEGAIYAGQGFVQLTGEDNYERAETAIRKQYPDIIANFEARTGKAFDLTTGDQPGDARDSANAQDPAIAYAIMSYGMRTGMFTGKKFSEYLNSKEKDYTEARRIINGRDKAATIAGYARKFEEILTAARGNSASETDTFTRTVPVIDNTIENLIPPATKEPAVQGKPPGGEDQLPAGDTTQIADTIVNTGAENPVATETKEVTAPAKEGSVNTATGLSIGGIGIPVGLIAIFKAVSDLVGQGYVDAKELGALVIGLVKDNLPYILMLVGLVIVLLIVRKMVKQITLWIQMYFAGQTDKNDVVVKGQ